MQGQHELADLAPRDVVAKAITRRMIETGRPHMWLDARHLGRGLLGAPVPHDPGRLPRARRRPGHRPDPGRPGPALRLGRGRHRPARPLRRPRPLRHRRGRLLRRPRRQPAGLQLPARGARLLPPDRRGPARRAARRGPTRSPTTRAPTGSSPGTGAATLQEVMTTRVGVLRSADGIAAGPRPARRPGARRQRRGPRRRRLGDDQPARPQHRPGPAPRCVREETRGSHWREDFPERDDVAWAGHVDSRLVDGVLRQELRPRPLDRPVHPHRGAPMTPTPYDALPPELLAEVRDAGLDPEQVYADIVRALAEDLPGGADDATSVATIPADATGSADWAAREPGVVAGLALAAMVFHYVMGDAVTITGRVARRHPRGRGRRGAPRRRPHPWPAHRRAHRAQLRQPPLRGRHRHQPLGRGPRGHRRPGPRHPQDAARLAGAAEVRRALRRRGQPPVQPRRQGDDQGQPRHRRRGRGRRPSRPCARRTPDSRSSARSPTSTSCAPCSTSARSGSCSTTWTTRRWPRRCAITAGRAVLEASGGLTLERARAVAETGRRLHLGRGPHPQRGGLRPRHGPRGRQAD